MNAPLLAAEGLEKRYGHLPALRGVGFRVASGETLGLVGESGSGKTTAGRIVARLLKPDAGSIDFAGEDWLALRGPELRRRRRELQIVFQDPQSSLNPRMRVGDQIGESLRVQGLARGTELLDRVGALLGEVGLPPALADRFPAELSGGQRQRSRSRGRSRPASPGRVRRAGLRARRFGGGADREPAARSPRARRALLPVHLARHRGRRARGRSHRGLLSRSSRSKKGPRATSPRGRSTLTRRRSCPRRPIPIPPERENGSCSPGGPPDARNPPSGCPFHPRCPIARREVPRRASRRSGRSLPEGPRRAFTPANCRDMRT